MDDGGGADRRVGNAGLRGTECACASQAGGSRPAHRLDFRGQERLDSGATGDDGEAARRGDEGLLRAGRVALSDLQHWSADQRVSAGGGGGGARGERDARAGRRGEAGAGQGSALGAWRGDGRGGFMGWTGAGDDAKSCSNRAGRQRGYAGGGHYGRGGCGGQLEAVGGAASGSGKGQDPAVQPQV